MEGMDVNSGFWQDKKVLVTGHTGFKGSWLCLWLQSLGANVSGFSLPPPTNPSMYEVADVARGMTSIIGDIRNGGALWDAMARAEPEIVIHMAAQPLVRRSYVDPVETYSTNVMGLVHLFEAVRKTPSVRAVVNVTSDKCYENREWPWGYRENEAMGGFDPYSSSKGCSELVTSAYRRSFLEKSGVALASARAGNVIGGGDWAEDRLVPDFLRAMDKGATLEIRSPGAVRPWQHVLEPLSGYLSLAERLFEEGGGFAEGWNFGPSDEDARSVRWIVEAMAEMHSGVEWRCDESEQPHEANYLKLDNSKSRARLGWRPRWSLGTALQKTLQWHDAWRSGKDMRSLTLQQIQNYQS